MDFNNKLACHPDVALVMDMFYTASSFDERGDHEEALESYEDLIEAFRYNNNPYVQVYLAHSMLLQALVMKLTCSVEDELAAYDTMITRFQFSEIPEVQMLVAQAILCLSDMMELSGNVSEELAGYDKLIDLFNNTDIPDIQIRVAHAKARRTVQALDASATSL